jgi:3-oxoacyl-[acyl-carrier protein] reductase
MDIDVRDRVYLVTGGSAGLGLATARALVADGARVVLTGRDGDRVGAAAGQFDGRALGVVADNADPTTPHRLLDAAAERFGRVDGLLVSSGGPVAGAVTAATDESWRAAFESVFLGAVRLIRTVGAALPVGGSIALVLSTSVRAPIPELAVSNGLRPGLAMVAKTLANELGPRGVRVNGLLPGWTATDRLRQLTSGLGGEAHRAALATIPLRRFAEPAEFGRVAAFVLSPAASYLTGAMVPVDGGLSPGI